MSFPPVLLELSTSADPTFRFTPFQLLDLAPTLLVDSMRDPLPPPQLARMLLAGMSDPSVDVRVEALKAMRSVVMEGLTGREREQIGDGLVHQAFAVSLSNRNILKSAHSGRRYTRFLSTYSRMR